MYTKQNTASTYQVLDLVFVFLAGVKVRLIVQLILWVSVICFFLVLSRLMVRCVGSLKTLV
jgi:hypothetical protein